MAGCMYFEEALEALSDRLPRDLWEKVRVHRIYCAARRARYEIKMEVNGASLESRQFAVLLEALGEAVTNGSRFERLVVHKNQRLVLSLSTPHL